MDCGKVIVRKRSFEWVEKMLDKGVENVCFSDVVDGKQRLNCLLEFVTNKFTDSKGNFFSDLSDFSQRRFYDFTGFSFGELGEATTDEEVLREFLVVNHSGRLQSEEHINYVKSLLKNKVMYDYLFINPKNFL